MSIKRSLIALAAGAAVMLPVAAASPAAAAEPACTNYVIWSSGARVPARNGSTNCGLYLEVTGNGVGALQRALNECYGKNLVIDNSFGYRTRTALSQVQAKDGRMGTADGVYGPGTRARLQYAGYTRLDGWFCAGR